MTTDLSLAPKKVLRGGLHIPIKEPRYLRTSTGFVLADLPQSPTHQVYSSPQRRPPMDFLEEEKSGGSEPVLSDTEGRSERRRRLKGHEMYPKGTSIARRKAMRLQRATRLLKESEFFSQCDPTARDVGLRLLLGDDFDDPSSNQPQDDIWNSTYPSIHAPPLSKQTASLSIRSEKDAGLLPPAPLTKSRLGVEPHGIPASPQSNTTHQTIPEFMMFPRPYNVLTLLTDQTSRTPSNFTEYRNTDYAVAATLTPEKRAEHVPSPARFRLPLPNAVDFGSDSSVGGSLSGKRLFRWHKNLGSENNTLILAMMAHPEQHYQHPEGDKPKGVLPRPMVFKPNPKNPRHPKLGRAQPASLDVILPATKSFHTASHK